MGVYIPYMKKPVACKSCPLAQKPDFDKIPVWTCFDGGDITDENFEVFDFVPNWCMLREIPEPAEGLLYPDKKLMIVEACDEK